MDKRGWHERQREQIAGLKRKQENIRRNKLMRAEQVIQNYYHAWRGMFPGDRSPLLEYLPSSGKYKLDHGLTTKVLPEAVITDTTANMYALAHEKELNNDPDEPGTDAYQADKAKGYAET